jgi:hypothetical protein
MKRYSIAALMIVILVVGVAFAALRDASDLWAGILLSLTLLLLASAALAIPYRKQGKRAFWFGFAIFGWGYLVLSQAPWFSEQVQPRLPMTALLGTIHAKLNPDGSRTGDAVPAAFAVTSRPGVPQTTVMYRTSPVSPADTSGPVTAGSITLRVFVLQGNLEQFLRVGQCLFALLAALLGGLVACWFQRTGQDAQTPPA